jgi:hypothetical protein
MEAANNSDLAKQLGISRRTYYRYKALPGAPAGLDVDAWKSHVAANRVNVSAEAVADASPVEGESYQAARARRTSALATIAELQAAATKRHMISADEVQSLFLAIAALLRAKVLRLENELPPALAGRSVEEIHRICRENFDGLLDSLADGLPKSFFEPKPLV